MEKGTDLSLTWQERVRFLEQDCAPLPQKKLREMPYLSLQH